MADGETKSGWFWAGLAAIPIGITIIGVVFSAGSRVTKLETSVEENTKLMTRIYERLMDHEAELGKAESDIEALQAVQAGTVKTLDVIADRLTIIAVPQSYDKGAR